MNINIKHFDIIHIKFEPFRLYFFGGFGPTFKDTYLDSCGEFRQITSYVNLDFIIL